MSGNETEVPSASEGLSGFLHFKTFITPLLVKILYLLQSVFILLSYPILVIVAFAKGDVVAGLLTAIVGLFVCAGALLAVRLWCEMTIVIFRIYEELRDRKA